MRLVIVFACLTAVGGCSRTPDRVHPPSFDPGNIGAQALAAYDGDQDGALSTAELEAVPSLQAGISRLDLDRDGRITAAEITARVEVWQELRAGLIPATCTVTQGGKPIRGATVAYIPEDFLGGNVQPAQGTTRSDGRAKLSVAEEHRPSPAYKGVQPGYYRIEVTLPDGGKADIGSNGGVEVASDFPTSHQVDLR